MMSSSNYTPAFNSTRTEAGIRVAIGGVDGREAEGRREPTTDPLQRAGDGTSVCIWSCMSTAILAFHLVMQE